MTTLRRQLSVETMVLFLLGTLFFGAGTFMCVSAYRAAQSGPGAVVIAAIETPLLPPALPADAETSSSPVFVPAPPPKSIFAAPPVVEVYTPPPEKPTWRPQPQRAEEPTAPSIVLGGPSTPFPPTRPIELNAALPPPIKPGASPPPPASEPVEVGAKPASMSEFDRFTAVYDVTAHTVYLPDGGRLEAHSGLADLRDDPSHVNIADKGATPPHVYDLTMREDLFHGVQALRLNPVGGPNSIFGRVGLLAHTYMLGPGGDSNGCVSFKNYDAFLQAFQSGHVKKLAVVAVLR